MFNDLTESIRVNFAYRSGLLFFLFLLYEIPMRIIDALRPSTHIRSMRIKEDIDGRSSHNKGILAVLAIKQDGAIPEDILSLINALNKHKIDVLVVQNGNLTNTSREVLIKHCYRIIVRNGSGRDFGSYKDGILSLNEDRFSQRLLLMNDSLIYFKERVDQLIQSLIKDDGKIIAATESLEPKYHLQSFILSFPHAVTSNPKFLNYWKKYLLINTRRYAINYGEKGFSKFLLKLRIPIKIIYNIADLQNALRDANLESLSTSKSMLLPIGIREKLLQTIFSFPINMKNLDRRNEIISALSSSVMEGSQVHFGAILYLLYLDMAIMKRDIFYRGVFSLHEIELALQYAGLSHYRDQIGSEFRIRGNRQSLSFIDKMKFDVGMI